MNTSFPDPCQYFFDTAVAYRNRRCQNVCYNIRFFWFTAEVAENAGVDKNS